MDSAHQPTTLAQFLGSVYPLDMTPSITGNVWRSSSWLFEKRNVWVIIAVL